MVETSRLLALGLLIDVLMSAVSPNLVALATGDMVARIPTAARLGLGSAAGHRLEMSFVVMALVFCGAMLAAPLHEFMSKTIRTRLTFALQSRLIGLASGPSGIAHLEDAQVQDRLALARGALSAFNPADAPAVLARVLANRLMWLFGCAILAGFRWWLGLALLALWTWARRPILHVIREHVLAFGGNATVMRRAFYFNDLATTAAMAKELRIFGLGEWVVQRFRRHWLDGMAEVWRVRSGVVRTIARVGVAVAAVYVAAFAIVARSALHHQISLSEFAVLLPVLAVTMWGGSITFDDVSLEWQLGSLPSLATLEDDLASKARAHDTIGTEAFRPLDHIQFEQVFFRYTPNGEDVLAGLDLTIPIGTSTALVGANGAGKTTIIKLLASLYEPTSGAIRVDGVDLATIDAQSWSRQLAVVFQDFARYPMTAAENIGLGSIEHLQDRRGIVEEAERLGIRAAIERLPNSWDTVLSREFSGGAELSGGQWQRVALARALFAARHGASILVLDEPTSGMDVRAEAAFFSEFLALTRGLTTILISHRFSTVRLAEHICVMGRQGLVERGSHDDLVAAGGEYARLFRLQAARFDDPAART